MLYENYENKLKKIAKFKVAVYKFRVLIIIIAALIFSGIATLIGLKGTITKDLTVSAETIVYGEDYSLSADAFLSKITVEFCGADGVWKEVKPTTVGEYRARAKTKKAFGKVVYGNEITFTILPAQLSVSFNGLITYGENPLNAVGLVKSDTLTVAKTDRLTAGEYSFDLTADDFIIKRGNENVAFCYQTVFPDHADITVSKKPISVTSDSAEKVYDGAPLLCETATATKTAYGDTLNLDFGEITDVGSAQNVFTATITDINGVDVGSSYQITPVFGTLTVKKRPITVSAVPVAKIYDGTPLTFSELTVINGELVLMQEFTDVEFYGTITAVGNVSGGVNVETLKITEGGIDKTANYSITGETALLTVEKRPVKPILTDSKIYDGQLFLASEFTYDTQGFYAPVSGHLFYVSSVSADVGEYVGENLEFTAFYGFDDVTTNYRIESSAVKLTVNKRELSVKPDDQSKIYDGTPLTAETVSVVGGLVSGHSVSDFTLSGEITDYGTAESTITSLSVIFGDDDVTENYSITCLSGNLTVNKLPVSITVSGAKVYDGNKSVLLSELSLSILTYDYNTSLIGDHECEFTVNDLPTANVGEYDLDAVYLGIIGGEKNESDNYDVTFINGIFTVSKRAVSVATSGGEKKFDGTPLKIESVSVSDLTPLAFGDVLSGADFPQITAVGTILNSPEIVIKNGGSEDVSANYQITVDYGELSVVKRIIEVGLYEVGKTYDGTSAVVDQRFWVKNKTELLDGDSIVSVSDLKVYLNEEQVALNAIINAGEYSVSGVGTANYGGAYSDYYQINVSGIITVERAKLTLVSASASGGFIEGTPLTAQSFNITFGDFVSGDAIDVTITGEQSEVGTSKNTVQRIIINDETLFTAGGGTFDFTNYRITVIEGTLTVY